MPTTKKPRLTNSMQVSYLIVRFCFCVFVIVELQFFLHFSFVFVFFFFFLVSSQRNHASPNVRQVHTIWFWISNGMQRLLCRMLPCLCEVEGVICIFLAGIIYCDSQALFPLFLNKYYRISLIYGYLLNLFS